MASAYTPGLTVSERTIIEKVRRLPLPGEVVVAEGEEVGPDTVVARAAIPGVLMSVKVAAILGIAAPEVAATLCVSIGDAVQKGQVIARSSSLWGLIKSEAKASVDGVVETLSSVTGNVGIRTPATPIELSAYVRGRIAQVLPGEGVVVQARGALVQGIFGVGGERQAPLKMVSLSPDAPLTEAALDESCRGKIVVGGSLVTAGALRRAAEVGVLGVVAGGVIDTDLRDFLGYDIGVAITGHEDLPFSLVLTEGFGEIAMAQKTFGLLRAREGRQASLCGATQIRAGVIRPEVIIAEEADSADAASSADNDFSLAVGTPIRLIREPYFGVLAEVAALPPELIVIGSGARVRVLEARLPSGEMVIVPRANVEIVAG